LKEIFSEAIGTIYYLAIGKKIGKPPPSEFRTPKLTLKYKDLCPTQVAIRKTFIYKWGEKKRRKERF
jgi:hypothetical protein